MKLLLGRKIHDHTNTVGLIYHGDQIEHARVRMPCVYRHSSHKTPNNFVLLHPTQLTTQQRPEATNLFFLFLFFQMNNLTITFSTYDSCQSINHKYVFPSQVEDILFR